MLWRDLVYSISTLVSISCIYVALTDPSQFNDVLLYTAAGSLTTTLGLHLWELK
mgnify:CR=1 FL=1